MIRGVEGRGRPTRLPHPARALAAALAVLAAVAGGTERTLASEAMFPVTPAGQIEVKPIPAATLMTTAGTETYFAETSDLFGRLFRFLRANDLAMTAPVEGRFADPVPRMAFFLGPGEDAGRLHGTAEVALVDSPARTVAAIGARGSYSEEHVLAARDRLKAWLGEHPELRPAGPPYAVFWDAPFVPWFLRRFEVHVPLQPAAGEPPALPAAGPG